MNIKFISALKNIFSIFDVPYVALIISFCIYFLLSFFHGKPWVVSDAPYFNYLADSFLHAQLNFRIMPPGMHA